KEPSEQKWRLPSRQQWSAAEQASGWLSRRRRAAVPGRRRRWVRVSNGDDAEQAEGQAGESGREQKKVLLEIDGGRRVFIGEAVGRRLGKWPPSRKVADGDAKQAVNLSRRRDGEGDDHTGRPGS
ncbi:hypothetical protein Dimus_017627, partial [Dionaea muscipula]